MAPQSRSPGAPLKPCSKRKQTSSNVSQNHPQRATARKAHLASENHSNIVTVQEMRACRRSGLKCCLLASMVSAHNPAHPLLCFAGYTLKVMSDSI
eukprot:1388112-Pleurochrysis_carterae.AAC.5